MKCTTQFYIPAVRIFGLGDTIPFYIRLSGTLGSLLAFLPQSPEIPTHGYPGTTASEVGSSMNSASGRPFDADPSKGVSSIEVKLSRRILTDLEGTKIWADMCIGNCVLRSLPPAAASSTRFSLESEVNVDWEGEIRCRPGLELYVGGFDVGDVAIQVGKLFADRLSLALKFQRTC